MKLSIVIVNWNTREFLCACLSSIQSLTQTKGLETIVVDNNSSDGSADLVSQQFPWVKLVRNEFNLGYAAGNNLGFEQATGEYVLTLNPDTEINQASLDLPVEILDHDSTVGCVGIKQIGIDGKIQASVRGFPSCIGIAGELLKLPGKIFDSYRLRSFDYTLEQEAPQPMGTFLMFRRAALAKVGDPACPFDPQFPIFFNEVDLLFRLKKAGFRCIYTPRAEIRHRGGESTRQVRPQMIWESHRSLVRYLNKHASSPSARILLRLLTPIVYLGALIRAKGFYAGFRS